MKKISRLLFLICLCVFIYSGYKLIDIYTEYKKGEGEYSDIQSSVEIKNNNRNGDKDTNRDIPPVKVDFKKLESINKDIVGWIYVESIPSINYPILKGSDNSYYLRHTSRKKRNIAGSIFMDYRNSIDFMDYNTIVYGHNMKNGTMFSKLEEIRDRKVDISKKPYVWIFTPNKTMVYKIFSVHEEPYTSKTYTIIKENGDQYYKYSEDEMKKNMIKNIDSNVDGKRILTLSTCTDNDRLRLIVQLKLERVVN